MRENKFIERFLAVIFMMFLAFLSFSTQQVYAATNSTISASDFDDGITGWQGGSNANKIGQIDIGTSSNW